MAFNINEIRSAVNGKGLYSPSHFSVFITGGGTELTTRCLGTNLPGMSLSTQPTQNYGIGTLEELPYETLFNSIDLTFIMDDKLAVSTFFHNWMRSIVQYDETRVGKFYFSYPETYFKNVEIQTYDKAGQAGLKYTLHKAYPKTISDVGVTWQSQNEYAILPITLAFKYWNTTNTDQSAAWSIGR